MVAENPLALQYIFADDLYLLPQEIAPVNVALQGIPVPQEPVVVITAPVAEIPAIKIPVIETPVIKFNYTGAYQKKFLVLVHYPDHDVMDQNHLIALESTFKRLELTLNDIALLNVSKHSDAVFETITTFFKPEKMLILGKGALPAGLTPPQLNQLTKLAGSNALYSFSFGEMMGNKENTKAFWEQMKAL